MTREEAARVLTELADEYERYELSKNGWLGTTYIPAHRMGADALREPLYNENVKECADILSELPDGETLTIWKKNGYLNAVRGKTIVAWKPLPDRKN